MKYILLSICVLGFLAGCNVQEETVQGGVMGTPNNDPYYNPNQSTGGGGSQIGGSGGHSHSEGGGGTQIGGGSGHSGGSSGGSPYYSGPNEALPPM